jgi:hypothetical protein
VSLKGFHIFFIVCSIVLVLGLGVWLYNGYASGQGAAALFYAGLAFAAAVGLTGYLVWFLRKMKKGSDEG